MKFVISVRMDLFCGKILRDAKERFMIKLAMFHLVISQIDLLGMKMLINGHVKNALIITITILLKIDV